jgi:hypothetical protein
MNAHPSIKVRYFIFFACDEVGATNGTTWQVLMMEQPEQFRMMHDVLDRKRRIFTPATA